MNQSQALNEAARYIGVYRWGDGFKIYYPWKDSDRRGARTESERRYWNDAQRCAALRKAELALWIYCDESETMPTMWRQWIGEVNGTMHFKQEMGGAITARQLLSVGVACIRDLCETAAKAEAEAEAEAEAD